MRNNPLLPRSLLLTRSVSCTGRRFSNSLLQSLKLCWRIDVPGAILACILAASAMGSPMATKMVKLSYETSPGSDQYDKGSDDAYFVAFWVLAFTFLRAFVMRYVFTPFAKAYGADTPAKQQRFAEQGWSFTYYSIFWSLGMVSIKT
jgi:acyl-CoA-dependent ceramide synthase